MAKNILKISLDTLTYSYINLPAGERYIGGSGLSDFLFLEHLRSVDENKLLSQPYFSITTGPLSGVYPYTSKSVVKSFISSDLDDVVGGGKIGSLLNISGVSSIEVQGTSNFPIMISIQDKSVEFIPYSRKKFDTLGYAGRKTSISFEADIINDNYFNLGSNRLLSTNLRGLVFSTSSDLLIKDMDYYEEVYNELLSKMGQLQVSKGTNPSCFGCPMGCAFSDRAENINTSALSRSLVSCAFAEPIYSDTNLVFKCLQTLGISVNHEDLEHFSFLVGETRKSISEILRNVNNS